MGVAASEVLRDARWRAGPSQAELARRAEVSQPVIRDDVRRLSEVEPKGLVGLGFWAFEPAP